MHVSWIEQARPAKVFFGTCLLFEMIAFAGALAGLGSGVRDTFLIFGGFWPELLKGASPVFPAQPVLMFGTSSVLHGGPLHLFMNMVALLWLAPMIVRRAGEDVFWPIAGLSALGAGVMFTLMSTSGTPMVGASGVLFGFLGTIAVWEVLDRYPIWNKLRELLQPAGVFLALNVALALMSGGSIAWEAHLGGFLAGMICGCLTWRRPLAYQRS